MDNISQQTHSGYGCNLDELPKDRLESLELEALPDVDGKPCYKARLLHDPRADLDVIITGLSVQFQEDRETFLFFLRGLRAAATVLADDQTEQRAIDSEESPDEDDEPSETDRMLLEFSLSSAGPTVDVIVDFPLGFDQSDLWTAIFGVSQEGHVHVDKGRCRTRQTETGAGDVSPSYVRRRLRVWGRNRAGNDYWFHGKFKLA